MNRVPSPTSVFGSGKTSSIRSSARIGPPAAIRPTIGTYVAAGTASPSPVASYDESSVVPQIARRAAISSGRNTSSARGRLGSRLMNPFASSSRSW